MNQKSRHQSVYSTIYTTVVLCMFALLTGCITMLQPGGTEEPIKHDISSMARRGLIREVAIDFTNTGDNDISLELNGLPFTIAETNGVAVMQTGAYELEMCSDDGSCAVIRVPIYEKVDFDASVMGVLSVNPSTVSLEAGETATVVVSVNNIEDARRPFLVRLLITSRSADATGRSLIGISGKSFAGVDTFP